MHSPRATYSDSKSRLLSNNIGVLVEAENEEDTRSGKDKNTTMKSMASKKLQRESKFERDMKAS